MARALRAAGRPVDADGFSKPYVAAVCYGSAFYGFLALVLSAAAARAALGDGGPAAGGEALAAAAVWVATPLALLHVRRRRRSRTRARRSPSRPFVLAWLRVRRALVDRAASSLLGALGALMAMVREQDAFFAVGPAVDFG